MAQGATFEQVAAAGFGIATANGAWRAVHRALARIPEEDADQAREAQLAPLRALRLLLWNHAGTDPIKAAEAIDLNAPLSAQQLASSYYSGADCELAERDLVDTARLYPNVICFYTLCIANDDPRLMER